MGNSRLCCIMQRCTKIDAVMCWDACHARDITALKVAEEKIRKIQAYTRSLIETSLDPQIIKGPDGKIST